VLERQSSPNPKLPWTSLGLLFVTYATFGWLLYGWTADRSIWLLAAFAATILGGIVTYPSRSVSLGFGGFFKTDTRAFILIVVTSIVSVLLLTSLQFFIDTVVLSTAGLLVSLDLKSNGWSKWFCLLSIVGWQLLGLSTGLALHYFSFHPIANLPEFIYTDYWLHLVDRIK
jgi:hypothetical protein